MVGSLTPCTCSTGMCLQSHLTAFPVSLAQYMRYAGAGASCAVLVALFAGQAAYLASEWWLALWSRASPDDQAQDRWAA
jgi:hypothetical protein